MSYPITQLGSSAFNHHSTHDAEQEYDRLRDLARQEAGKRSSCMDKSHQAYTRGDGASAKSLSDEGHRHAALMDQYNHQASDYIFRENNALSRVPADTIDLHGQFVDEAERILEQRIRTAKQEGQDHLHVIVGKGNHSPGHVQRIKPKVEELCRELGLQYQTEPNAGRMYVNLRGGAATMPEAVVGAGNNYGYAQGYGGRPGQGYGYAQQQQQYQQGGGGGGGGGGGYQGQHHQQQHQQQQQQGYHGGGQQQDPNAELEAEVKKYLPKILRQIRRSCCVVM